MERKKHASLFTGIGGFDLAAEWMGWDNVFQCEIDPYCNKLLKQNFPNTKKHGNIKETDFTIYRGRIDVLSGGFPCQPYSTAGKRLGKEDERHLWPYMFRSIQQIQPPWIVGENVRGLTNWNGGLVFDEVQADLEAAGYEVTPFLLPAAGVNAPHRRDRIFFIAYSGRFASYRRESIRPEKGINNWKDDRREEETNVGERLHQERFVADTQGLRERPRPSQQGKDVTGREQLEGTEQRRYDNDNGTGRFVADSASFRRNGELYKGEGIQRGEQTRGEAGAGNYEIVTNTTQQPEREQANQTYTEPDSRETRPIVGSGSESIADAASSGRKQVDREGNSEQPHQNCPPGYWSNFPTQPGICRGDDGIPNRVHRLKGLGNAVVPQVVLQIFKAIEAYEQQQ
jgi:DNA (cytosine-5)-methyltransferase 1